MSWQTAQESARSGWLRLLGLLVAVTCLFAVADTVADPDLWGHLRFGRDILRSGHAIQRDRYSYLSDRPWINHEWLAEVMFASVYQAGGPSGLVIFKAALGSLVLAAGYQSLRRKIHPIGGSLFMLAVALALRPGLGSVRPQIFTYLMFLILLLVLRRSSSGRAAGTLWLAVPVFTAWANLHGGVLAGLAVILIWGFFMSWEILRASVGELPRIGEAREHRAAAGRVPPGGDGQSPWPGAPPLPGGDGDRCSARDLGMGADFRGERPRPGLRGAPDDFRLRLGHEPEAAGPAGLRSPSGHGVRALARGPPPAALRDRDDDPRRRARRRRCRSVDAAGTPVPKDPACGSAWRLWLPSGSCRS